ncbi:hypothetical protein [Parasitella parasitica]|uniref:F-box domain-containing protein n=1 Tax=Parasitella parasitica TaxID=35722 RepID=A0A0B7NKI2_9FUNG|nr:hypothetical protein [Parasitella parasitica]
MAYQLPPEVLQILFDFDLEIRQLAQCRGVCKAWKRGAEMAMSRKAIVICGKEMAQGFYEHFVLKSEFGKNIKHLTIACQLHENFNCDQSPYKQILKSLVYERLEVIDGEVNESFYQLLTDIDRESEGKKNSMLKRLPDPSLSFYEEAMHKAALCFARSLEQVRVLVSLSTYDANFFIRHLGTFKLLTSIDLVMERCSINEINAIAEKCLQLKELRLSAVYDDRWTTSYVRTVFHQNYRPTTSSLKVLKLEKCFSAIPLEVLVMKYGLIESVSINLETYPVFLTNRILQGYMYNRNFPLRLAKALRGVPKYEISFYDDDYWCPLLHFQVAAAATGHDIEFDVSTEVQGLTIAKATLRPYQT